MKVFVVLFSFLAVAACAEHCYNEVVAACSRQDPVPDKAVPEEQKCTALYGAANAVVSDLQSYANLHFTRSFQYLLMATHFGNYEKNREGFEKLYRKLSDSAWEKGIDLIKYITKRGEKMSFKAHKTDNLLETEASTYETYELGSLSRALDIEKGLAEEAALIHGEVTRRREAFHDPEIADYIERHFAHEKADNIRELAGYTNDLKSLLNEPKTANLAVFLFDEYLKKAV